MRALLWIGGGLVGLIACIALGGGFIIATAILFACTARGFGRDALPADIAIGFVMGASIYLLFLKLLTLSLPGGHGHGCGHNLLGSAALLAATAMKNWLAENKLPGVGDAHGIASLQMLRSTPPSLAARRCGAISVTGPASSVVSIQARRVRPPSSSWRCWREL